MAVPVSVLRWLHSDSRGIVPAALAGDSRATLGPWTENKASLADFRGYVISVLATCANLGATPTALDSTSNTVTIMVKASDSAPNVDAQFALLNGLIALIVQRDAARWQWVQDYAARGTKQTVMSSDGEPDTNPVDTSNPIIIGAGAVAVAGMAVVAVAGIVAGTVAWIHSQDTELKALEITTNSKVQEHAATLEQSRGIIEGHLEREFQAKASIPWDTQELNYLNFLEQSTKDLAGWQAPPLRTVPDLKVMSDATSDAVKDFGKNIGQAAMTGTMILTLAAAVVAVVAFSDK